MNRPFVIAASLFFASTFGLHGFASQETASALSPPGRIVTSDIALFWHSWDVWQAHEHGDPKRLAPVLQREYLDKGSPGVRAFIPNRIRSAENLANVILQNVAYYEAERPITERLAKDEDKMDSVFRALHDILPEAKEPTIYLVIGARNSGGTSSDKGLILGTEMFSERPNSQLHPNDLWSVATHELIHYQQKGGGKTLLTKALTEGAADFFAERLIGRETNENLKSYGDAHERELWQAFSIERDSKDLSEWLYNGSSTRFTGAGRPPDLGYYEGYKICQSYYDSHTDKAAALRTLLVMRDPARVLSESGYSERFR